MGPEPEVDLGLALGKIHLEDLGFAAPEDLGSGSGVEDLLRERSAAIHAVGGETQRHRLGSVVRDDDAGLACSLIHREDTRERPLGPKCRQEARHIIIPTGSWQARGSGGGGGYVGGGRKRASLVVRDAVVAHLALTYRDTRDLGGVSGAQSRAGGVRTIEWGWGWRRIPAIVIILAYRARSSHDALFGLGITGDLLAFPNVGTSFARARRRAAIVHAIPIGVGTAQNRSRGGGLRNALVSLFGASTGTTPTGHRLLAHAVEITCSTVGNVYRVPGDLIGPNGVSGAGGAGGTGAVLIELRTPNREGNATIVTQADSIAGGSAARSIDGATRSAVRANRRTREALDRGWGGTGTRTGLAEDVHTLSRVASAPGRALLRDQASTRTLGRCRVAGRGSERAAIVPILPRCIRPGRSDGPVRRRHFHVLHAGDNRRIVPVVERVDLGRGGHDQARQETEDRDENQRLCNEVPQGGSVPGGHKGGREVIKLLTKRSLRKSGKPDAFWFVLVFIVSRSIHFRLFSLRKGENKVSL